MDTSGSDSESSSEMECSSRSVSDRSSSDPSSEWSSSDLETDLPSTDESMETRSETDSGGYATDSSSECDLNSDSFEYDSNSDRENTNCGSTPIQPGAFNLPPQYFDSIYEGADLTVIDSYILLFQYSLRHSLTKKAFSELIQLVSVHLPHSAKSAESLYKVKGLFLKMFDDIKQEVYKFCSKCHRLLETTRTCPSGCCSGVEEFLHIPLEPQLKRKLEGKVVLLSLMAFRPVVTGNGTLL